jgi:alpha-beta hydrolase superfamily lysophospholipase
MSYAEDVKVTKAVIVRQLRPVVLVGHSYGGSVITESGNDPAMFFDCIALAFFAHIARAYGSGPIGGWNPRGALRRGSHWRELRHNRENAATRGRGLAMGTA